MELEQYKAFLAQKYTSKPKFKKANVVKIMSCTNIKQLLLLRKKLKID